MSRIAKVAISLPEDILRAVEMERRAKGESRSQFFLRAVERLLQQERESGAVREYVRGYEEMPESAEEVEAARRAGDVVLAQEPWE
jgi:metal-responsive CopG/Arc/MetJ family transcriptional regulator